MSKKESFSFQANNDVVLKGNFYIPNDDIKSIVVICHGMAEHIERYDEFASFLANNNILVCGYDQRGHGKTLLSMDDMGYMSDNDNFNVLVNDLFEIVKFVKDKFPNLSVTIIGHSMGSFVLQRYIELYGTSIDRAILSGSSLNKGFMINLGYYIAKIITKFKGRRYKSKLMDNLSLGAYNKPFKPNRTKVDWLSTNKENVDKYINDELCGKMFTVSYFKDLLNGFRTINKNFELVPRKLPLYIFSGADDPVGNMSKGTKALYNKYNQINMENIELKLYPNGRHEMLNECNKAEVYSDVLNWINKNTF